MTTVSVGVEWINDFHSDACNQNQLVYMNTHAEGFQQAMVSHGHSAAFDWGDDNAWETDFRNPAFGSGGDALNWSDNVNFCYFADHGGNWSNIMHIAFSKSHNECLASSDTWKLGVKNLKWLVLDVCDGTLDTTAAAVVDVWGGPMQGLHMLFTFVNITSPWSSMLAVGKRCRMRGSTAPTVPALVTRPSQSLPAQRNRRQLAGGRTRRSAGGTMRSPQRAGSPGSGATDDDRSHQGGYARPAAVAAADILASRASGKRAGAPTNCRQLHAECQGAERTDRPGRDHLHLCRGPIRFDLASRFRGFSVC
jgi:hypothetical protein